MVFVRDWEVGGMGKVGPSVQTFCKMKVSGHGVLGTMIKWDSV